MENEEWSAALAWAAHVLGTTANFFLSWAADYNTALHLLPAIFLNQPISRLVMQGKHMHLQEVDDDTLQELQDPEV